VHTFSLPIVITSELALTLRFQNLINFSVVRNLMHNKQTDRSGGQNRIG